MHRKNSKECCALWVRGFAALWAVLVLAEAFSIRTAVAQPFATQPNNFNPRLLMIPPAAANCQIGYAR